ncbi:MAG: hypothetical protein ACI87O_002275 [Planctomycetota bacterium]|jgi:hypothetical protein
MRILDVGMPRMGRNKKTNLEDPVFLNLGGAREARPAGDPYGSGGNLAVQRTYEYAKEKHTQRTDRR